MSDTLTVFLDIGHEVVNSLAEKCASQAGLRLLAHEGDGSPDLLVHLVERDLEAEATALNAFLDKHPQADIILLGDPTDSHALVWAMRAGVLDFLPADMGEDDLGPRLESFVQERLKRQGGEPKKGRLVSVLSVKGGAGATTVAVNLAHTLQKKAHPQDVAVALVDLGLPYGEAQMFLDVNCKHHWGDAITNLSRLDASYLLGLMTRHSSGLRLLPPPTQPEDLQIVGAEVMGFLVEQARKVFDVVVLDLGGYLDEVTLRLVEHSDDVLLVGVQSVACKRNLHRIMDYFSAGKGLARPVYKLVVNRHLPQSNLTVAELEEAAGIAAFRLIPNDYLVSLGAINQGVPIAEYAPKSALAKELTAMAKALVQTDPHTPQAGQAAKVRRFALSWSGA